MTTSPFAFHLPGDLAGVTGALAGADDGTVLLGGSTMVVPDITHGRVQPRTVIDLSRAGLAGISADDAGVTVGAMTTYTELCGDRGALVPLLARVAGGITGGPQIRNRGTVGGSASYANPASDMPTCLVALGAKMRLVRDSGTREVPAEDFFLGAFRTVREPDEVLSAMIIPPLGEGATGYLKFKLAESSWPIVTAAALVAPGGRPDVVVGGATATPARLAVDRPSATTADPAWRAHVREVVSGALDGAVGGAWTDVLADGAYRRRIAPVIATRAIAEALGEADQGRERA